MEVPEFYQDAKQTIKYTLHMECCELDISLKLDPGRPFKWICTAEEQNRASRMFAWQTNTDITGGLVPVSI
jgi:hypothetical protein